MSSLFARCLATTIAAGIPFVAPANAEAPDLLELGGRSPDHDLTSATQLAANAVITVTGHRLPEGAAEVKGRPGGTDLVYADQYKSKVAVSLKDALAFSPGVYAQPRFGQEIRLSIRGSGISRGYHMRGLAVAGRRPHLSRRRQWRFPGT